MNFVALHLVSEAQSHEVGAVSVLSMHRIAVLIFQDLHFHDEFRIFEYMPTIIETRPISMSLGPIQMSGLLFVADPAEDSFIEVRVNVLGVLQVEVMAHVGEPAVVTVTIPEGLASITFSFDVPTSSFLCQVQPKDTKTAAEWHVLAALGPS